MGWRRGGYSNRLFKKIFPDSFRPVSLHIKYFSVSTIQKDRALAIKLRIWWLYKIGPKSSKFIKEKFIKSRARTLWRVAIQIPEQLGPSIFVCNNCEGHTLEGIQCDQSLKALNLCCNITHWECYTRTNIIKHHLPCTTVIGLITPR